MFLRPVRVSLWAPGGTRTAVGVSSASSAMSAERDNGPAISSSGSGALGAADGMTVALSRVMDGV